MQSLFASVGYSNPNFTLNLGEKFNTSKVTNMSWMLADVGYANSNMVLDLSSFTFDNVTNYSSMINRFLTTQKIYVKNAED